MELKKQKCDFINDVRKVDGFPLGKDADLAELSDEPMYTAYPNPFIKDYINEHGHVYSEEDDSYKCEPFAADVSEGKSDPIYNAHTYHTKVPYKAIMRYILHYTQPGDIVLDGFCGTGMTGVAANMCGHPERQFKALIDYEMPYVKWGKRYPVIADISPAATFISKNYCANTDVLKFEQEARRILSEAEKECAWMYETAHAAETSLLAGLGIKGKIIYTVWSDVLVCSNCGSEIVFYDAAVNSETGKVSDKFCCPCCGAELKKNDCEKAFTSYFDEDLGELHDIIKQKPVLIRYQYGNKRYNKVPDEDDIKKIQAINEAKIPYWYPTDRLCEGKESRRNDKIGITHVHHFFYKRTLYVLAKIYDLISRAENKDLLKLMFTSQIINISKMNRYRPQVSFPYNPLSGTMYVSSMISEANPFNAYEGKIDKFVVALKDNKNNDYCISTGSTTQLLVPDNSCDYIFTDPPFGDNLNYSELSFLWEAWLKVITNSKYEAIVNPTMGKQLPEYQELMTKCFSEYFRVLKPNRWMTVEFHNSKNAVWNAIQEALQRAGFIVADVRTLDKQGSSFKQVSTTSAVKQDLIISVYKPKESFYKEFSSHYGTDETAWAFVRQHLAKLPVVVDSDKNGKIDVIVERKAFLLFDRMVAYHVIQGMPVPIDSGNFYKGLDERFIKRDDMYFLPEQVNEYDTARIKMDIEDVQLSFLVTNEKTAREWLFMQLSEPQTYAEIQPKFMQEVKAIDKYESMPELSVLLEENFLQDENGRWYIPDRTKEGDIAKLREKNLWKEFEGYMNSKGKLKLFRSEAVRAGFSRLWKEKNYQTIVDIAERLPEKTIQEDQNLLMYYDISLSRV